MYVDKYGEDGKRELNQVASEHKITLDYTTNPKISTCGCEVSGGYLRLLFAKDRLGYNLPYVCEELGRAVNDAGKALASAVGADGIPLDFDAKQSIKKDWDPKAPQVESRLKDMLKTPVLTLTSNFESNFAALAAYSNSLSEVDRIKWKRDWQKYYGGGVLAYFDKLAHNMEYAGFAKDDMLQDGFKEAVENNEISFKVVQKLDKERWNETTIENGVLVIKTTPPGWTMNTGDIGNKVLDLL